jgi:hypothetical protein
MSREIMKFRIFALAALACFISVGFANAQTAPPDPNPDITARAKDWLHRVQTGNIDRSQLDATMNNALTPDLVKQASGQLSPLGDPVTFTFVSTQPVRDDITAYVYHATFKSGALNEVFALHKDGKIAGIQFTPAQ